MSEDEAGSRKGSAGKADFEFTMNYEVLPAIEIKDVSRSCARPVKLLILRTKLKSRLRSKIVSSARTGSEKGKAEDGDRVTMDYPVSWKTFLLKGGADQDAQLVLGSGQFIPGRRLQPVGVKAGDEKQIKVTFLKITVALPIWPVKKQPSTSP